MNMEAIVLAPLAAIEASLQTLILTLGTSTAFSTAPATAEALLSADDALTSALTTLKQHQDNYARILHLRDEANRLQEQIKSVVRTCGELKAEAGRIQEGVLDEEDSDDDETDNEGFSGRVKEVDYETLLSFAARIGKHNVVAAREAERDAMRRRTEVKKTQTNGDTAATASEGVEDSTNIPQGAREILAARDAEVAMDRAYKGMAFPAAEILRLGALGQLQLVREQGGEEAVEREAERMVQESEGRPPEQAESDAGMLDAVMDAIEREEQPAEASKPQAHVSRRTSQTGPRPPQEKKKLNLSLWEEGDDDDDDDDDDG